MIGKTTRESMQSGFVFGFAGQADAIISRLCAERGPETGSPLAASRADRSGNAEHPPHPPDLTLEGLEMIWRRQQR